MRARDDAARSAALLRARGFVARARAGDRNPRRPAPCRRPAAFDAVVATSAKAIALLAPAARAAIAGLPLYVVGEQTARAATEAGIAIAGEPAPDVAALSAALRRRLAPHSRVLYLAGRERKSGAGGRSEPSRPSRRRRWRFMPPRRAPPGAPTRRARWPDAAAALHYSRRSAALAVELARGAGLADRFRALLHVCLSPDAANRCALGARRASFAPREPREDQLIDALERALAAAIGTAIGRADPLIYIDAAARL